MISDTRPLDDLPLCLLSIKSIFNSLTPSPNTTGGRQANNIMPLPQGNFTFGVSGVMSVRLVPIRATLSTVSSATAFDGPSHELVITKSTTVKLNCAFKFRGIFQKSSVRNSFRLYLQLNWTSITSRQKNNLPANQKGYDTFETTTVGKLSARRIQICFEYFCKIYC